MCIRTFPFPNHSSRRWRKYCQIPLSLLILLQLAKGLCAKVFALIHSKFLSQSFVSAPLRKSGN
ncbi:Uncharacterised protein [Vibrio cholerae]|nr:Uncharacterised protein [Vibrio cholerae]